MIGPAEFRKLMEFLGKAYPRFTLGPETIEVYYQILGDLSLDLVKAAILQLISDDSPWCPSAGQIRGCAFDLLDREANVPTAWDAWAEVCKRIGDIGYDRKWIPEFSHSLIKRTVDAVGGWLVLCMSENAIADRARFVQAYETLAKRERAQARMLPQVRKVLELVGDEKRQVIEAVTGKCVDKLRGDSDGLKKIADSAPEPVADGRGQ